jgi:hypothetical protein
MPNNVTIRVLDHNAHPVRGAKVTLSISGVFSGGMLSECTDSSGHAEFTTAGNYESSRSFKVFIKGKSYGSYRIGGGSFTVTLD